MCKLRRGKSRDVHCCWCWCDGVRSLVGTADSGAARHCAVELAWFNSNAPGKVGREYVKPASRTCLRAVPCSVVPCRVVPCSVVLHCIAASGAAAMPATHFTQSLYSSRKWRTRKRHLTIHLATGGVRPALAPQWQCRLLFKMPARTNQLSQQFAWRLQFSSSAVHRSSKTDRPQCIIDTCITVDSWGQGPRRRQSKSG